MRPSHLAPALLLLACAPDTAPPQGVLPFEVVAAPPTAPMLDLIVSGIHPAQTASFTVEGLQPLETVYIVRSAATATPGWCPPVAGGMCLELASPVSVLGTARADSSGRATLVLSVPAGVPAGLQVAFQAAAVRGTGGGASVRSPAIRRVVGQVPAASIATAVEGDLVITEVLADPVAVSDAVGEWFEIYNASGVDLDVAGLRVTDRGLDTFVVPLSRVVPADGHLVLGASADPAINGGVPVDLAWSGLALAEAGDELVLSNATVEIDEVAWDGGPVFPAPSGASISLDPRFVTAWDNDRGDLWCVDHPGTPGRVNDPCGPPACGDWALDPGEQCDDGGTAPGDGCDALCRLEGCPVPERVTGEWTWPSYGLTPSDVAVGPDGDLYLADVRTVPGPSYRAWIARVDGETMTTEWAVEWPSSVDHGMGDLRVGADGGPVLAYTRRAGGVAAPAARLAALEPSGQVLFREDLELTVSPTTGCPAGDCTFQALRTLPLPGGGLLLLGVASSTGAALRLDPAGSLMWFRTWDLDGSAATYEQVVDAARLTNGDFLLAITGFNGLLRIDATGNVVWSRAVDLGGSTVQGLVAAASGGAWVLVGGYLTNMGLLRVEADGDLAWAQMLYPSGSPSVSTISGTIGAVPLVCEGVVSDGDPCSAYGQRCATGPLDCTCGAGSSWQCAPGEQTLVLGGLYYVSGGGTSPFLLTTRVDGTPLREASKAWQTGGAFQVDTRGGITGIWVRGYDRILYRTDEDLSGLCGGSAVSTFQAASWTVPWTSRAPWDVSQSLTVQPLGDLQAAAPLGAPLLDCSTTVCP